MRNITAALVHLDPAGAAQYCAHAAGSIKEIPAVDRWTRAQMAEVSAAKRRALASHDLLQYLANACCCR